LQPSLFIRLADAEAELRAMKDMLAEVLEMLAEMKANQTSCSKSGMSGANGRTWL